MAIWLPVERFLVTAAPGTGSTSLIAALADMDHAVAVPAADVVVDGETVLDQKHATAHQLIEAGVIELGADVRVLTTVRNPFDYWPSEWERTRRRWVGELRDPSSWVFRQPGMLDRIVDAVELPFDAWLLHTLDGDLTARRRHHLNEGHVEEADVVLRMEHLSDDLSAAFGRRMEVPHRNRTEGRRPYWQYYSEAARAAVAVVNAPTIDRFGYVF